MPVIRTFISHHGGDLQDRVEPILRRVAPLGIRPWLDKRDLGDRVGLPLGEQLQEAIFNGPCSSLCLFLTKSAATRKWIEQEVQWALGQPSQHFRVIPIWLDPPGEIELPETFRGFLERQKVLWLEPAKDPRFLEKYAASVYAAGGLDQTTRELTLYLGHRSPQWVASLPPQWAATPALDLRLHLDGADNFCPSDADWREIEQGLRIVRSSLVGIERLNICGQAPLGIGTLIGKIWDRCSGVNATVHLRSYNTKTQQVWSTNADEYEPIDAWTPEQAQALQMVRPAILHHRSVLLVLLPQGKDEYLTHVQRWNAQREQAPLIHVVRLPHTIRDSAHASQVLRECVGVFRFLRQPGSTLETIEVVSGYPLALAPLLSYHLRTLGPLHFYDEVKETHQYRLATTIP